MSPSARYLKHKGLKRTSQAREVPLYPNAETHFPPVPRCCAQTEFGEQCRNEARPHLNLCTQHWKMAGKPLPRTQGT